MAGVDPADRPEALFLLTILVGLLAVIAGVARLGRYTRFVSHSVMPGFLTGVSVNIITGHPRGPLGAEATGATGLAKAIHPPVHNRAGGRTGRTGRARHPVDEEDEHPPRHTSR